MKFPNRLAQLRGEISQADFARSIGLSQQNYGNYENGKQGLKSDLIRRICTTYSCTAEWLLCFDEGEGEGSAFEGELLSMFNGMTEEGQCALIACARGLFGKYGKGKNK